MAGKFQIAIKMCRKREEDSKSDKQIIAKVLSLTHNINWSESQERSKFLSIQIFMQCSTPSFDCTCMDSCILFMYQLRWKCFFFFSRMVLLLVKSICCKSIFVDKIGSSVFVFVSSFQYFQKSFLFFIPQFTWSPTQ